METDTLYQTEVFFIFILAGMAAGLFHDTVFGRENMYENIIKDSFYWIVLEITLLYLLHYRAEGVIRWYMIFGMAAGAFIYFRWISSLFYKVKACICKVFRPLSQVILKMRERFVKPESTGSKR